MSNAAHTQAVANTILAQIKQADFWAMARWGVRAKTFFEKDGLPTLDLTVPRKRVLIQLAADDTYTVIVGSIVKYHWTEKKRIEGVYDDSLVRVIDSAISN